AHARAICRDRVGLGLAAESARRVAAELAPAAPRLADRRRPLARAPGRASLSRCVAPLVPGASAIMTNVASLVAQAQEHYAQGRVTEAEETLRRAAALEPGDWAVPINLGRLLRACGRPAEAAEAFRAALALVPFSVAALVGLSDALVASGQFD